MAKKTVKRIKTEGDFWLLILTLLLCVFGLLMVYSASYYHSISKYGDPTHFMINHGIYMLVGWAAFIFLSGFDYHRFRKWTPLILLVGVLLLIVVLIYGITLNNAQRWIQIGPVSIMPGEVIKTCMIFGLAFYFSLQKENVSTLKGLLPVFAVSLLVFGLICLQPNYSTAAVVLLIIVLICFAAGLPWKFVFLAAAAFGGLIALALILKGGYVLDRIRIIFDPWSDALGDGYQVVQGLLALGSGGVLGKGLGGSIQKALYLPEPENDYILAIIGEELGYVGLLILILVYLLLIWRIFRAAVRAADKYGMLIAAGVGIHISVHVILNIAIVSATFFPTGIVLPFISYGGNALILFIAEAGLAYNVSRYPDEKYLSENRKTEESR